MAACFAASDSTVKYVGSTLPVLIVLWVRYAFQAIVMALWLAPGGAAAFRSRHPRFQCLRGALLLATSALAFFGLQRMPVAEFTALAMLTPVVVTLLAAGMLREDVSMSRWALVWGGFVGAVIVIRPGSGVFGWVALFPLALAICSGGFQVLTSRLAALESPYTTSFYSGASGLVLLTPLFWIGGGNALMATLHAATWPQLALALGVGVLATSGHLFLIFAFGLAPMATLMPFTYCQIGFAVVSSWVVFSHVPDGWAWCGMAVIAVCGATSAWLNVREAQARRPASVVAADTIAD